MYNVYKKAERYGIRKVVILQTNQDWIITDWSNDITLMDGCVLTIKKLLDEEEIDY
ncbi:hypothetical protein [Spirosoma flavum]|uniref:Uncharacterized protein n=1 Tax=Spirosoma flavum TaxID=2048557 RepID=A0ABW6AEX6_9BACT